MSATTPTHSTPSVPPEDTGVPALPLLNQLLQEQQTLSAVEEFAQEHSNGVPDQARYYQKLLPASPPSEGQQYAFAVDLDRCSGCKACVTACHSLNGLDDGETWRDVGLLIGGSEASPLMQHVTTSCHHCLEPACASACPVDAYTKDPQTGIVRHLDDQCFGCQYCTLACPYDVPKYHSGKGIVRKCDMCHGRLAAGEAPACVQACPHEAISIDVVDRQQVVQDAETGHFLPAAPDPQFTLPTTQFKTKRVFPRNTLPANYHAVNPQAPHWPLIIMLVLTQLSVGAILTGLIMAPSVDNTTLPLFQQIHATSAMICGLLALAASTLHLGRPLYAWRAMIGLRHSWLSREIVLFGIFAGAAVSYALASWFIPDSPITLIAGWSVAVSGVAGVLCSAMIYVVTGREFWSFSGTTGRFLLSCVILGIAAVWMSLSCVVSNHPSSRVLMMQWTSHLVPALILATAAKLLLELSLLRYLLRRRQSPLRRSALLLTGPLARSTLARCGCALVGGIVMPLFLSLELSTPDPRDLLTGTVILLQLLFCLGGELLERFQFFAACSAPRMPGPVT